MNQNLIPYETIVRATEGEPDTEDNIKSRLVAALFKFRFDEQAT